VPLTPVRRLPLAKMPVDFAVNVGVPDGPKASASSSVSPEAVAEAIDGRMWFFPENPNGWSPALDDKSPESWYAVDFGGARTLGSVELAFFADGVAFKAPAAYRLQSKTERGWQDLPAQTRTPEQPLAGGVNRISFPLVTTAALRLLVTKPPDAGSFRLIELKAFGPR